MYICFIQLVFKNVCKNMTNKDRIYDKNKFNTYKKWNMILLCYLERYIFFLIV